MLSGASIGVALMGMFGTSVHGFNCHYGFCGSYGNILHVNEVLCEATLCN